MRNGSSLRSTPRHSKQKQRCKAEQHDDQEEDAGTVHPRSFGSTRRFVNARSRFRGAMAVGCYAHWRPIPNGKMMNLKNLLGQPSAVLPLLMSLVALLIVSVAFPRFPGRPG